MAEQNYRVEEMFLDEELDFAVRNTYFSCLDAAANFMQLKIEEYMRYNCWYACYITHLVGDCPQLAQYVQKEYLR